MADRIPVVDIFCFGRDFRSMTYMFVKKCICLKCWEKACDWNLIHLNTLLISVALICFIVN